MNTNCNINNCDLSMINGNSIDIKMQGCDSEIKADILVKEYNSTRVWGQVRNCDGKPIANALLKLVKVVHDADGTCFYQGIAHTVSDCEGFYQFDVCIDECCSSEYKILVGKSSVGQERIIMTGDGNCKACTTTGYNPCGEYNYRVTPADKIVCNGNTSNGCSESCTNVNTSCNCNQSSSYDYCVKPKSMCK